MLKLEYTSRVDDTIKMFTYVIPKHLKLIRQTKVAKEHGYTLACMQCDSVLSPHPLNKYCTICLKSCCNQCFKKWTGEY